MSSKIVQKNSINKIKQFQIYICFHDWKEPIDNYRLSFVQYLALDLAVENKNESKGMGTLYT